tara:strand:+ start:377 stop:583 length:207 start_codon:yes stop_codon:yes gene_type:complete
MVTESEVRKTQEKEYIRVQGQLRLAFAKGSEEVVHSKNLCYSHIETLKQAWGQDFVFSEDGGQIKLRT